MDISQTTISTGLLHSYIDPISKLDYRTIAATEPSRSLLIEKVDSLSVYYAPFDSVNYDAKVIIVGITPGRVQMNESLVSLKRAIDSGSTLNEAMKSTKKVASFAGPMRSNLVLMLDYFRVDKLLGISTTKQLFGSSSNLVHNTSMLRYPVFKDGINYNGTPSISRNKTLQKYVTTYLREELMAIPSAIVIPLGEKVAAALDWLSSRCDIGSQRILHGFQHPSGANRERIGYLLHLKDRDRLSKQVIPEKIDEARARINQQVELLLSKQRDSVI